MISASIARWAERDQDRTNAIFRGWLEEHQDRLRELEAVTQKIVDQATQAGPVAQARLNDDKYLPLARQGFRVWDKSETPEKRELVRRVLTNAACDSLCSDDFVRRFIEWIDYYNELHFRVIRTLFRSPFSTRSDIWGELNNEDVREDSSEADLFKLLIRDLSTGGVIRQARQTDPYGNFIKKSPRRKSTSRVMKSAFDDQDEYVLTDLGKDFVHYALNEVVPKLPAPVPSEVRSEPAESC
ncbi:hypothetical protein [Sorangium cellulosum]|uniref:hypothetical protein n=1 Tax=Sorangium cellulosum TaxID=56 RepID=UPI0012DB7544|nr:hypothetical protein [Sorangium cellulosum]